MFGWLLSLILGADAGCRMDPGGGSNRIGYGIDPSG